MDRMAIATELVRVAEELVAGGKKATLTKRDFVSLAAIMKSTGVSKNEGFVEAVTGWLKTQNPMFDTERFKEALGY